MMTKHVEVQDDKWGRGSSALQMLQGQPSSGGDAFLRPLHLDSLHPDHVRPLSDPFRVFAFDFAHPPSEDGQALLEVTTNLRPPQFYLTSVSLKGACLEDVHSLAGMGHLREASRHSFWGREYDRRQVQGGYGRNVQVSAKENGRCTAVAVWWELLLDAGGTIVISTAPSWVPPRPVGCSPCLPSSHVERRQQQSHHQ